MRSIIDRLRRLEEQGRPCPQCGLSPGERRPMAVIWEGQPERGFQGNPHEVCSSCNEPLHVVIRVVYDG